MRKVSFDELMQAVDFMADNPYAYGDDIPEDMEYNGYEISFRNSHQLNQCVVRECGSKGATYVEYNGKLPTTIYYAGRNYNPREYFIAYVERDLKRLNRDPDAYGYVNGKPVYSHDEFAIAARGFGPIESDEDLIAYAEKETGHWSEAGWQRTLTTYYLSESDHIYSHLTYNEWKRLKELQAKARAAYKAAEDARQWRKVETLYWADNSIEEIWEDKDGIRKTVLVEGPHGDACY